MHKHLNAIPMHFKVTDYPLTLAPNKAGLLNCLNRLQERVKRDECLV